LRNDDLGPLWEHFVLNELQAHLQGQSVLYWRDKSQHEVDFILRKRGGNPLAIECKWSSDNFDPTNLQAFRRQYPRGENIVVAADVTRSFRRTHGDIEIQYNSLARLCEMI
jgi:predicted AAA+ superfamily ATPase